MENAVVVPSMRWTIEIANLLAIEYSNEHHPASLSLIECGHSNFVALRQAAQTLSRGNCGSLFSAQLQPLIDKSYEHMQRLVQQSAIIAWRRLYTDSCILKSLLAFDAQTALESISILDRAIIIAGAVGYGRHNLVLSIINKIQSIFLPYDDSACRSISRSLTENFDDGALLLTATKAISSISPPTFLSFQSDHSRHPFILRCYAEDWPALCEHSWSSARYLRSISGRGRIVPVEVGKDYRRMDWTQILMSWDEFLSSLDLHDQPHTRSNEEIFYLAQHHLMMQFPPLRDDIVVPDYVYAEVSHSDYQAYKPPQNDDRLILNTWLGPRGTISPAHTDPYHNIYVQVVGSKSVWLAPPSISSYMFADPENRPITNLLNTSPVDVFSETVDEENPNFWTHVVPNAMSAVLAPGDLLFIPPGWWHAMRSETTSFSVSMWF